MILSCEIVPELIALQEKLCKTHQSWNLKQDHQKMEHGKHIQSIAVSVNSLSNYQCL